MKYIKNLETLEDFCQEIASDAFITFDTEFIREKTYRPELCLIQVAGEKSAALIDVLAFSDITPLLKLFKDERIVKVCHSGQQDLEIFYEDYGLIPTPLADTQIMAMCNGYGENVAYHVLVTSICKIHLSKEMQLTNWKKRPLSDKQKDYAIGDVTHLRQVYEVLLEALKAKNRESWIEEEVAKLTNEDKYRFDAASGWRKIKVKKHNSKQLSIVKALAFWREEQAYKQNQNRARILSDEVIYEMSVAEPKNKSQLFDLRKVFPRQIERYTDELLDTIHTASTLPIDEMPKVPKRKVISDQHQSFIELLKLLLKLVSVDYSVAPKLIANASDIEHFICNTTHEKQAEFMKGWRYEIFGKRAEDMISGKLFLGYADGQIVFKSDSSQVE